MAGAGPAAARPANPRSPGPHGLALTLCGPSPNLAALKTRKVELCSHLSACRSLRARTQLPGQYTSARSPRIAAVACMPDWLVPNGHFF